MPEAQADRQQVESATPPRAEEIVELLGIIGGDVLERILENKPGDLPDTLLRQLEAKNRADAVSTVKIYLLAKLRGRWPQLELSESIIQQAATSANSIVDSAFESTAN